MQTSEEMPVFVRSEWDEWRTAEVRLGDLKDIHWFKPKGAPRPLAHGYISCASISAGNIPHDCERTAGPHRLLVCVIKSHSAPSVYAEVARRAGQQPVRVAGAGPQMQGPRLGPFDVGAISRTIRRLGSR